MVHFKNLTLLKAWGTTLCLLCILVLFGCSGGGGSGLIDPIAISVVEEVEATPTPIYSSKGITTDTHVAIGSFTAVGTPTPNVTASFSFKSAPVLSSSSFVTNDNVTCTIDYDDRDSLGAVLVPTFYFYNKKKEGTPRDTQRLPSGTKSATYKLRPVAVGRDVLDTDIRTDKIYCAVTLTNGLSNLTSAFSEEQTVQDVAPVIALASGSAIQSNLNAGDTIAQINLAGTDADGDTVSFEEVSKDCNGLSLDTASGAVTGQVPTASTPPADRICTATYRATANGKTSSNTLSITLQIPNHAPSVNCLNKTQTLAIDSAPFPQIQCTGTDSDVGATLTYSISGCSNNFTITQSGVVSGTMPTSSCTATVTVSDGVLSATDTLTFTANNKFLAIPQSHPSSTSLLGETPKAVAFSSAALFLALSGNGGLAISTDFGSSFKMRTTSNGLGTNEIVGVAYTSSKLYVAASKLSSNAGAPGVYLSTDHGVSFTLRNGSGGTALSDLDIRALAAYQSYVYVGTATGLFVSEDSGETYTQMTDSEGMPLANNGAGPNPAEVLSIHIDPSNNANIYVGTNEGIAYSTDAGRNYTVVTPSNKVVEGIYGSGAKIYAATQNRLAVTSNYGTNFSYYGTVQGFPTNSLKGVTIDSGRIYVCTTSGLVMSTDNTFSWYVRNAGDGLGANGCLVPAVSSSKIYAAGTGSFSLSTNSGTSFVSSTNIFSVSQVNDLRVITTSSPYKIYAATNNGILISTDGGASFRKQTASIASTTVHGIEVNGTTVFAATDAGLSISNDGGTTWTNRTNGGAGTIVNNRVYDVHYHAAGGGTLYAATDGGLSISTDGGATFSTVLSGESISGGVTRAGNLVFVGIPGGGTPGLRMSNDGGINFGAAITTGLTNTVVRDVYADAGGTNIYVGTSTGFSLSTNNGTNFATVAALNGISARKIHSSGASVFVSHDTALAISTNYASNFSSLTPSNGLSDKTIKGVFFDGTYLWTGNGSGGINRKRP